MIDLTAPVEILGETPNITHLDLFYPGRRAPDASLVTDCVVIDLTDGAETVDTDALHELSLVRTGRSVILRTGWERYRGSPKYDESPSVDHALLDRLVALGVSLILVDSPGVYGGARGAEHNQVDKYLADHEAYAVENLVNVGGLPTTPFRLYCFPIYSARRNNAPCRVVADVPG